MNASDIRNQLAAARAAGYRIRDAAVSIGISEGEAIAAHCGAHDAPLRAVPLHGPWIDVLQALQPCGPVLALTRNASTVHEKTGVYEKLSANGHIGLALGEQIDLRLFFEKWHAGFAVTEDAANAANPPSLSLQFFDAHGEAVHKIFARDAGHGKQYLVYSMSYAASEDLAMVLPLPVPVGSKEDAVKFIDLHDYSDFFSDLFTGFLEPDAMNGAEPSRGLRTAAARSIPLEVVQVGSFEASFVPQVADFARLDARFRMPDGVWDKLPAYKRSGFAVFKLRKSARAVHPMAFVFPRADASKLFFPTVHIHDGKVHDTARFDHSLYCQVGSQFGKTNGWDETPELARTFMNVERSHGIIDGSTHCYRKVMKGKLKNQDTLL